MSKRTKAWLEAAVDRRAVTALEYGLITAMIGLAIAVAMGSLNTDLTTTLTIIATKLLAPAGK